MYVERGLDAAEAAGKLQRAEGHGEHAACDMGDASGVVDHAVDYGLGAEDFVRV